VAVSGSLSQKIKIQPTTDSTERYSKDENNYQISLQGILCLLLYIPDCLFGTLFSDRLLRKNRQLL